MSVTDARRGYILLDVNEAWCREFRYQREQVLGRTGMDIGMVSTAQSDALQVRLQRPRLQDETVLREALEQHVLSGGCDEIGLDHLYAALAANPAPAGLDVIQKAVAFVAQFRDLQPSNVAYIELREAVERWRQSTPSASATESVARTAPRPSNGGTRTTPDARLGSAAEEEG